MYTAFFGLTKEPFPVTPDGGKPFLGDTHKEALAALFHGIERRRGFVQIVGEVGTGKTTILRACLNALDPKDYATVVVLDPNMSFRELLAHIAGELGEDTQLNGYALVSRVHARLIEEYNAGRNVVLVVDEAHNMPVRTLELLRMLSNVETNDSKLVQIVLAGQPELDELLGRRELRQLRQRIGVRAVIEPLSDTDARAYLAQRLAEAGGHLGSVLTGGAVDEIVRHARGVPRVLNIAADTTLIHALGAQRRPATRTLAREALTTLGGPAGPLPWYRRPALAASVLGVLTAAAVVWLYFERDAPRVGVAHAGASPEAAPAPVDRTMPPVAPIEREAPPAETATPDEHAGHTAVALAAPGGGPVAPAQSSPEAPALEAATSPETAPVRALPQVVDAELLMATHRDRIKWDTDPLPATFYPAKYTAKKGDMISQLCFDIYGFADGELYDLLLAANPELASVDSLEPDQTLVFPPLTEALEQSRQQYIAGKLRRQDNAR